MEITAEGMTRDYDKRGAAICKCGCGKLFPSKKMFFDFLSQFTDLDAWADIYLVDRGKRQEIVVKVQWEYEK